MHLLKKPSAPNKAMCEDTNMVTPSPISKEELKPSSTKVYSSRAKFSAVTSSLIAFNLSSNVLPAHANFCPSTKKSLTSALPSPSSPKVSTNSQRMEIPIAWWHLFHALCGMSSILNSWDEDFYHEIKVETQEEKKFSSTTSMTELKESNYSSCLKDVSDKNNEDEALMSSASILL